MKVPSSREVSDTIPLTGEWLSKVKAGYEGQKKATSIAFDEGRVDFLRSGTRTDLKIRQPKSGDYLASASLRCYPCAQNIVP